MNLLAVENLGKNFGERVLFEGLSFGLSKGDKVALIANNGTGKSSMLKILAGQDAADEGEVIFRNECRVSYLSQDAIFDDSLTINELINSAHNKISVLVKEYEKAVDNHSKVGNPQTEKLVEELTAKMERENAWDYQRKSEQILSKFNINNLQQKVGKLSGGQKKRLSLALLLLENADILLLDEPTNHLDMEMRQALTMALQSFGGAILLISHDRHLLANNVDQFLLIDDGEVQEYAGDLQDYSTRILANLSKSHPKKSAGKAKTPGANKKADQKLLRQIKAEIMGAEKRLKRLQEKIGEVEAVLQSPDTYDGNFQDDLHDLIRNQTELKSQIEEVEKVWLIANEKLEAEQSD